MAKKVRTVLPTAFAENGKLINVIVETPRRCRNKFKYDEKLGLFRLNSVLPAGAAFPMTSGSSRARRPRTAIRSTSCF